MLFASNICGQTSRLRNPKPRIEPKRHVMVDGSLNIIDRETDEGGATEHLLPLYWKLWSHSMRLPE